MLQSSDFILQILFQEVSRFFHNAGPGNIQQVGLQHVILFFNPVRPIFKCLPGRCYKNGEPACPFHLFSDDRASIQHAGIYFYGIRKNIPFKNMEPP
ncbi:hypothetical protein SDC9_199433 [bioreactor metagenome]|uniref:Uncharacterized protein n=1 Tax=bioreactor metagenome TaxID=1076179 RepID=A0A645ITR5_9ZZZZ